MNVTLACRLSSLLPSSSILLAEMFSRIALRGSSAAATARRQFSVSTQVRRNVRRRLNCKWLRHRSQGQWTSCANRALSLLLLLYGLAILNPRLESHYRSFRSSVERSIQLSLRCQFVRLNLLVSVSFPFYGVTVPEAFMRRHVRDRARRPSLVRSRPDR